MGSPIILPGRQTHDANVGRGLRLPEANSLQVQVELDNFAKALKTLKFYDVGKTKGYLERNRKPLNSNQARIRFLMERQFVQRKCDPIIEYLNLNDEDERDGFIGVMMARIQGLKIFSDHAAFDVNDLHNLRVQWEMMCDRFCEITGFPRNG